MYVSSYIKRERERARLRRGGAAGAMAGKAVILN
jgi:hypothetical protein